MEIDEEVKKEIDHVAEVIVKALEERGTVLINIQVEPEYSQYDVLFSCNFENYGRFQRGILATDLIIGVMGFGVYGFRIDITDTDPSYYAEKLKVHSNFLSLLFNEVRSKLKLRKKSQ